MKSLFGLSNQALKQFMNKPGVILISTLLIVMIMSIISIQISKKFFISMQRESYIDFKNQSMQLLLISENQAINYLKKDIISFQEKLTSKDSFLNQSYFFSNDYGTIEVDIKDASNCFNLNSIFKSKGETSSINKYNRKWLERLLLLEGIDTLDAESFVDQLIDWVDADNQPLNFGAENYFYIGPLSAINQFTAKRLLAHLSEIQNFPIMQKLNFNKLSRNLCVLPGNTNQLININTLNSEQVFLVASFFGEENLEFTESLILNAPKNGYDGVEEFISKFKTFDEMPRGVLAINSKIFRLNSAIINDNFSSELESLVILDISNSAKVLDRNFKF